MKAPAFQFYPGDFLSSSTVQLMTTYQIGAYILLLCYAWQNDRPGYLPNCEDQLRRLARLTVKQWQCSRTILLSKFPEAAGEPGWRHNPRLEREVLKQAVRREKLAENGRLGGRPISKQASTSLSTDIHYFTETTKNQKLSEEKLLVSEEKAFAKPSNFSFTSSTSEVESVAEAATPTRASKRQFAAPTLEQVRAYATEAYPREPIALEEATSFFNHFESNGWKVGGKAAMAKWQPSFQNWMRRRSHFATSPGSVIGSPGTIIPSRAQIAPKSVDDISRIS